MKPMKEQVQRLDRSRRGKSPTLNRFASELSTGMRQIRITETGLNSRLENVTVSIQIREETTPTATTTTKTFHNADNIQRRKVQQPSSEIQVRQPQRDTPPVHRSHKRRRIGQEPTKYDSILEQLNIARRKKWNACRANPDGRIRDIIVLEHPTRTAILGHSFVNRLRYSLMDQMKYQPRWGKTLDVDSANIHPLLYGIPGATIEDSDRLLSYLYRNQPDDVILELGTNDIGQGVPVEQIARNLIQLCEYWLRELINVHSLTWCHVTPRCSGNKKNHFIRKFNRDAAWLNRRMAEAATHNLRLHHWRHRGLSRATIADMPDGVHPGSSDSMWSYQKSISRLCKWAKRNWFHNLPTLWTGTYATVIVL